MTRVGLSGRRYGSVVRSIPETRSSIRESEFTISDFGIVFRELEFRNCISRFVFRESDLAIRFSGNACRVGLLAERLYPRSESSTVCQLALILCVCCHAELAAVIGKG